LWEPDQQSGKLITNEGFLISLSIAHEKSSIADEFSRRLISNDGISDSFSGKPINNGGFLVSVAGRRSRIGDCSWFLGKTHWQRGILIKKPGDIEMTFELSGSITPPAGAIQHARPRGQDPLVVARGSGGARVIQLGLKMIF